MLKISRLADYAALLMQRLVQADGASLSAADLAEQSNIAYPTVSKVLKQLAEAKLVLSHRGVNGGYRLARAAESISLYQLIAAIDGEIALTECSASEGQCVHGAQCPLSGSWQSVSQLVSRILSMIKLSEMSKPLKFNLLLEKLYQQTKQVM